MSREEGNYSEVSRSEVNVALSFIIWSFVKSHLTSSSLFSSLIKLGWKISHRFFKVHYKKFFMISGTSVNLWCLSLPVMSESLLPFYPFLHYFVIGHLRFSTSNLKD